MITRRKALVGALAFPVAAAIPAAISSPVAGIDIARHAGEVASVRDLAGRHRLIRFQFNTDLRLWIELGDQLILAEPA